MTSLLISKKRTTISIDEKLLDEVSTMAKADARSVSYMISVLLEYAIKEKSRNRKPKRSDNS